MGELYKSCLLHLSPAYQPDRAAEVPHSHAPNLPLEGFMVNLYNNHTVQRVLLVAPDGSARAHEVLGRRSRFVGG